MKSYSYFVIFLLAILYGGDVVAQGWQWARGNTGNSMEGWAVATDVRGNVFVGGFVAGMPPIIDFGSISLTGVGGAIIAKYDGLGNVLWVDAVFHGDIADGSINADILPYNIATDPIGNAYMFGSFNCKSINVGSIKLTNSVYPLAQYFLVKYSANGAVMWAVNGCNSPGYGSYLGTIAYQVGVGGVSTDDAGNVYITSFFTKSTVTIGTTTLVNSDPSGSTSDIFIAKYDPSGNVVWAKSFGGNKSDEAYGITVTRSGDIYISGDFGSSSIAFGASVVVNPAIATAGKIAYIARLNSSGDAIWATSSGGNGTDYAVSLASDISNNVYLTGGFEESAISFGSKILTNPTPGRPSLYLVKFDPSNSVVWGKIIYEPGVSLDSINKTGGAYGYSVAVSPCGLVWVCGAMKDSAIIDGHILRKPRYSLDPIFVVAYSNEGAYQESSALSSGSDDQTGIAIDPAGNLYMCSDYESDYPFIVGRDTLPAGGSEFFYVTKYTNQITGNEDVKHTLQMVCGQEGTILTAPAGYANYIWSTGATTAEITYAGGSNIVYVYGFDSCTSAETDTFIVGKICGCGSTLYVPNLFTPNGDGQNDIFYPRGGADISLVKSFRVYDRWGEVVFEKSNIAINDATNAWEGKYKGMDPRPDVFVWTAEVQCTDGRTSNHKGNVTILR